MFRRMNTFVQAEEVGNGQMHLCALIELLDKEYCGGQRDADSHITVHSTSSLNITFLSSPCPVFLSGLHVTIKIQHYSIVSRSYFNSTLGIQRSIN